MLIVNLTTKRVDLKAAINLCNGQFILFRSRALKPPTVLRGLQSEILACNTVRRGSLIRINMALVKSTVCFLFFLSLCGVDVQGLSSAHSRKARAAINTNLVSQNGMWKRVINKKEVHLKIYFVLMKRTRYKFYVR